jgi:hypothetical protein
MKRQIAGALVASLLIGSAPVWAEGENATTKPQVEEGMARQQFRDSIDRAIDRSVEGQPASGPELTALERRDLDTRRAELKTDPVARGAGGVVMLLVSTAISIGLTAYLIKKTKTTTTTPSLGRP